MTHKSTLLAIDDSPTNLKLLGQILGSDYRLLFSTRGADGLEMALNQAPDLILTDVVMPEMDGHEVCRQLKANPLTAKIPIIFITSLKDETDEAYGLEIGAIDYITKPFSPAIVKARVHNHLQLKHYRDLLESQAATDGLTGVPNRRQFNETLEREWRSAIRRQSCISLILMDIDYFKPYNDFYGHLQGDECLRSVGQALLGAARRPTELIARYGGEEFACILPDTDKDGAVHVARELLVRVQGLQITHLKSTVSNHVTLSLGVASIIPTVGSQAEELILTADAQLYTAKHSGRNQVCS